ncbi:MAG TPA: DUF6165 family protein [Candidatus Dependentiae bacterium]|nr:DUF6165 family protein [Candidatus Dependentiae bacterium]HRQ62260.1 DUF6165 family protein [Candidatus Dependentiae bacterium]
MKPHYMTSLVIFLIFTGSLYSTQINTVLAEIGIGELIDKITILQIKSERITDPKKLQNVQTELTTLQATYSEHITTNKDLEELTNMLRKINEKLWDIEDAIRQKEYTKNFDAEFIALARSVYINNDLRGRIKHTINKLCGSHIVEEKSYAAY